MAELIDGKKISQDLKDEVKAQVAELKANGVEVTLAVILVGNDPASTVYVGNKKKACEYTGINSKSFAHSFDPYGERLGPWADERDGEFLSEIQEEFGVGSMTSVSITANGKGSIVMDGMTLPSANYKAKFFAGNAMVLTAVPEAGSVFGGWTGCEPVAGTPETCVATVAEGLSITASFK